MDKKAKMIKIGNTSFRNDIGSVMKYKQFKEVYSDKLKGIDIDKAWTELGGKLPTRSD